MTGGSGRPVSIPVGEDTIAASWFGPEREDGRAEIVLLHEGLGSISMWTDFPEVLADATGVSVFAYERQGHGGSGRPRLPRPKDYMHNEALAVLPAILQHQQIRRPVLFGHSDGATIALIHAAHHDVRGVVSEAAHVYRDDMMEGGARRATAQWAKGVLRRFLVEHHGAHAEMLLTGWLDWWRNAMRRDWNVLGELEMITAPVLAIQGTEDAYGMPDQVDRICAAVAGSCDKHFIEGAGHIPHHEARAIVLELFQPWAGTHAVLTA